MGHPPKVYQPIKRMDPLHLGGIPSRSEPGGTDVTVTLRLVSAATVRAFGADEVGARRSGPTAPADQARRDGALDIRRALLGVPSRSA